MNNVAIDVSDVRVGGVMAEIRYNNFRHRESQSIKLNNTHSHKSDVYRIDWTG